MRRFLFIVGLICFSTIGAFANAASDTFRIELGVYHCDNDSICEVAENAEFCPLDCTAPTATTTEDESEDESGSRQGSRVFEQIIDLFETYIPFIGVPGEEFAPGTFFDESGYVCTDGSCTTFTDDLTRSVLVSFEAVSGGGGNGTVSISPISGSELSFEWKEGIVMRIMRSPKEFPIDPLSGELVYEGSSGSFTAFGMPDSGIMYYSLFPKRGDGSYGDPEFVIVKSQVVDDKKATSTFLTVAVNTFFVAVLGFIGRFIFLLI